MNVTITARKFKAHDTLKEFINAEVDSLNKFHDDILDVDVILSYLNSNISIKSAEIILKVPGQILTATENSDDFKKSISSAVEKLVTQLKKIKSKKVTARIK